MSEKLPYEEAFERQMNDLPSPYEEESWLKMKILLDEEKDRKVPFVLFKNVKAWVLLALLLVAGTWLVFRPFNAPKEKTITSENKVGLPQKNTTIPSPKVENKSQVTNPPVSKTIREYANDQKINSVNTTHSDETQETFVQQKTRFSKNKATSFRLRNPLNGTYLSSTKKATVKKQSGNIDKNLPHEEDSSAGSITKNVPAETILSSPAEKQPQLKNTLKDSISPVATITVKDSTSTKKADASNGKRYIISAGIGLQQSIPVSGQQAVHYGHKGNNSTISDYIPSLYVRIEKEKKWFAETGFSYGSPQLVKQFAYSQHTNAGVTNAIITTTLRLKKTFYSEVPLSLHYYLKPNWSAGMGAMYSWFHGAIAEKETLTKNIQTQEQTVVKEIVPITGYTDSFLYRSHTYLLLQTDYHWQKFSMGLRYAKDMQPYIKYTLPDGSIKDQKNWSLEFIVRYRLWKQAK